MKNFLILLVIAVSLFSCETESLNDAAPFPQENNPDVDPDVTIDELDEVDGQ
ncbi:MULTISPECIES: hypothetical protein [Aquimarina]|uniref:hypothetical protein n=1 Tax=Aquimarina TaxID=290174 RepID=UPI000A40A573|nr:MULTISPECIES: hypothetical protein [Aquimarina]